MYIDVFAFACFRSSLSSWPISQWVSSRVTITIAFIGLPVGAADLLSAFIDLD